MPASIRDVAARANVSPATVSRVLNGREDVSAVLRDRVLAAVDDLGYCGHCHWAVRAEIEEGFYQLREYLRSWARFTDWCDARGLASA